MIILIFIIGLILGTSINLLSYQIQKEKGIFKEIKCNGCGEKAKLNEFIPLISFIKTKGRCKKCKNKLGYINIITEIITAVVIVLIYLKFSLGLLFIKFAFLFAVLILSSLIDIQSMNVYFAVSTVGIVGGIIFSIIDFISGGSLVQTIISVSIPLVILGLIMLLSLKHEGMGGGDLEVFLFIALYLNPIQIVIALLSSIIIAGIVSVGSLIIGKKEKYIAFIPYITIGTLVAVLFGDKIVNMLL